MYRFIISSLLLLLLSACTNQRIYDSFQGAKTFSCGNTIDSIERARCFDNANKRYDSYHRDKDDLFDTKNR